MCNKDSPKAIPLRKNKEHKDSQKTIENTKTHIEDTKHEDYHIGINGLT